MGDGSDTVNLSGFGFKFNNVGNNTITLGSGKDSVTMGSGEEADTFILNDTIGNLVLSGSNNTIMVNGGHDTITDTPGGADALTLKIGAHSSNVTITNFSTASGLVDLVPSLGFSTSAQAFAALHSDGYGGTLLDFKGGSIDFVGVTNLTASSFAIG
jgi:hypothetical protein